MSFLGGLFGGSKPQEQQQQQASASGDLLGSTSFRSNVASSPSPSQSEFAPDAAPATPAPSAAGMLGSSFDVSKLHPMAELNENLDFLALDDDKLTDVEGAASVLPSRGWTDDLCVGTGTTYLSGAGGVGDTLTCRVDSGWSVGLEGGPVAAAGRQRLVPSPVEQRPQQLYQERELYWQLVWYPR